MPGFAAIEERRIESAVGVRQVLAQRHVLRLKGLQRLHGRECLSGISRLQQRRVEVPVCIGEIPAHFAVVRLQSPGALEEVRSCGEIPSHAADNALI